MKKPNLFLVGPPKCGTTAMYYFLKQHPDIYMSQRKEPCFFAFGLGELKRFNFAHPDSYNEYMSWFRFASKEKILGEATTFYFTYPEVSERIKQFNPNAKIIAGMRQPRTTLQSWYNFYSRGEAYPVFEKKRFFTKDGNVNPHLFLLPHIKRYHSSFGNNFRVYLFEEFKTDSLSTMKKIYSFLGVDVLFSPEIRTIHKTFPINRRFAFLLTPFGRFPIWAGRLGINRFIKNQIGPQRAYSLLKRYEEAYYAIRRKLSHEATQKLDIHPELLATLEEDYQKALNYCKEKEILL